MASSNNEENELLGWLFVILSILYSLYWLVTKCIEALSHALQAVALMPWKNFIYHFRWGLHWIICLASLIGFTWSVYWYIQNRFDFRRDWSTVLTIGFVAPVLLTILSFIFVNPSDLLHWEMTTSQQIKKAQKSINQLEKNRDEKFKSQLDKNRYEINEVREKLKQISPSVPYQDYEQCLRSTESYLEFCNLIEREALLTLYIELLNEKISKIDNTILKLDHNKWELEKDLEHKDLVTIEDIEKIKELIDTVDFLIEKEIDPSRDKQELAKRQEQIFNKYKKNY